MAPLVKCLLCQREALSSIPKPTFCVTHTHTQTHLGVPGHILSLLVPQITPWHALSPLTLPKVKQGTMEVTCPSLLTEAWWLGQLPGSVYTPSHSVITHGHSSDPSVPLQPSPLWLWRNLLWRALLL